MASQTNSYTANAICGTFASQYSYINPGLFSSANLTGLTPATKYYYRVGALVRSCCSSPLRRCYNQGRNFAEEGEIEMAPLPALAMLWLEIWDGKRYMTRPT